MLLLALMLIQTASGPATHPMRCDVDLSQTTEQRDYAGIYVDDFEGQRFFEGAEEIADLDFRQPNVWIEFDRSAAVNQFGMAPMYPEQAYRVRFRGTQGREIAPGRMPCGYGHMAGSVQEVHVTELVAMDRLGPVR